MDGTHRTRGIRGDGSAGGTRSSTVLRGAVLLVLSLSIGSASSAQNLFTNGSFEQGVNPGSFVSGLGPGATNITDWTVIAGTIDYVGTFWQPSDGDRSVDLAGPVQGSIGQTVPTVPGNRYRVEFDLAGNPSGAPIKTIGVTAAGQVDHFDFDITGRTATDMGWTREAFEFTASDDATRVAFVALTGGNVGPTLDNVSVVDLGPPASAPPNGAALEVRSAYQFELLYNDSGSGGDRDGAFHRPLPPPGFYAIGHQGQAHYGVPGLSGLPGASILVARALEPDALVAPVGFELVWEDSASGASLDGAAWRPLPPTDLPSSYRCLGHFFTRGRVAPDLAGDAVTQRALAQYRCVRADLTAPGVIGRRIWDDQGTGANLDFSAWEVVPADSTGLAVGGFVGENGYGVPTEAVYVLDAAATRPAPAPDLSAGPFLELRLLRETQVSGGCDFNPAIYNDSGTGATFSDVSWWHPQPVPSDFHQLGHTYERFHNPTCPLDSMIVARELVPGALAAPIGWDLYPETPNVDPVWTDQGSGGDNNGALWKPIPPAGYVCLGSFATGGYGYAPPDSPVYVSSGNAIDQAVADAAQNFRCVREDLVVPARLSELGWNDGDSGAGIDVSMWEIEPADRVGAEAGIDVGHFWSVRGYAMPLDLLYTLDVDAVAEVETLSQLDFDALLDKGPRLQVHFQERFQPDDPVHTLDNDVELCHARVPDEDDRYGLEDADSIGEDCDVQIATGFLGIPSGVTVTDCSAIQPNAAAFAPPDAGDGSFFASPPQCAPTTSTTLAADVAALLSSPDATDPDWKMWLDIDVGPTEPVYRLPENPTDPNGVATGDASRAKAVVRVLPWNGIGYEVQYWLWYPYNGPGLFEVGCGSQDARHRTSTSGRHEGDWELISLRYDVGGTLVEVYLSRHSGEAVLGVKPSPTGLTGIGSVGLQPLILAAENSHAHYTGVGPATYEEPFSLDLVVCTLYLRLEDFSTNGPELDLANRSRLIVASSEFPGIATESTPWLHFPGRWGAYEHVAFSADAEVAGQDLYSYAFGEVGAGPSGPPFKAVWRVPEPSGGWVMGVAALAWAARRRGARPRGEDTLRA